MQKIKVVDAILKIIDGKRKGELVLQQRSNVNSSFHYICQSTWAGKVEPSEDIMDAVKRECLEELGEEFYRAFDFSRLKFICTENSETNGKNYLVYNYEGEVTEALLNKARLHGEAMPNFLFINQKTDIFPLSSNKNPKDNIVVFDDQYRVLNKIFNGNKRNQK